VLAVDLGMQFGRAGPSIDVVTAGSDIEFTDHDHCLDDAVVIGIAGTPPDADACHAGQAGRARSKQTRHASWRSGNCGLLD
jgi:hypothetical protein